jgi:hypothetical protein
MVQVRNARDFLIELSVVDIVLVYDAPARMGGLKGSQTSRLKSILLVSLLIAYEFSVFSPEDLQLLSLLSRRPMLPVDTIISTC